MSATLKFGAGKWAAKAGSVLAYNDLNDNFKPLPFTFTRASTATRVNESGLIESVASGVPRIDFLDNADGHLLLEPSRTNLLTDSEDATSVNWSQGRVTATANQSESPDGNVSADLIFDTPTTIGTHRMFTPTISALSGTVYTFSIYIKKGTSYRGEINLINLVESSISSGSGTFDLNTLTSTGGCSIDLTLVNGYYRVTYTTTCNSTTTGRIALYQYSSSGLRSYTGDGTSTWHIWGAQLEAGSYATSYIPTIGSSVTRAADSASQTPVSGIIGQSEGTVYAEVKASVLSKMAALDTQRVLMLSDGTNSNRVLFNLYIDGSNRRAEFVVVSGGSVQSSLGVATTGGDKIYKIAGAYKANDFVMYVDGVQVGTDTSGNVFSGTTLSRFDLGQDRTGTLQQANPIVQVKLYNTRLSNSELAALTSL